MNERERIRLLEEEQRKAVLSALKGLSNDLEITRNSIHSLDKKCAVIEHRQQEMLRKINTLESNSQKNRENVIVLEKTYVSREDLDKQIKEKSMKFGGASGGVIGAATSLIAQIAKRWLGF